MEFQEDRQKTAEEDKVSPVKSDDRGDNEQPPAKIFGNFLEEHQIPAEEAETAAETATEPTREPVVNQPLELVEEPPVDKAVEDSSQASKEKQIIEPPSEPLKLAVASQPQVITEEPPVPPPAHSSNNSLDAQKDPASDPELPPIPTAIEPNRSRKLSEIMTLAYKQRKELNRADFQLLVKRRSNYFEKHVGVFDHATFHLLGRMKETNEFIPSVLKYGNQLTEIYKNFQEGSKKMSAFRFLVEPQDGKKAPDNRLSWSSDLNKGIKGMLELKDQTSTKMRSMESDIVNSLLPAIEKALHDYNKRLEHLHKLSDKQKEKYLSSEQEVGKKVKKVNKLFSEDNPEGKDKKDLLATELDVFSEFAKAKKDLVQWGTALQTWWTEAIAIEKLLVTQIKKSILGLLELYENIHGLSEKKRQCDEYWQLLNVDTDIDRKYSILSILPTSQYDFFKVSVISMYDTKHGEFNFGDWTKFSSLEAEEKIMGDKRALLHSLILKRFDCQMMEGDRPKHKATVASTVDEFLVFYDQAELHCYNKMQLKRLMNTRRSDYQVCCNEKIEGFIVDSWNRQTLHFRTPDTAEEFMFYTENVPDVKKQYVQ